MKLKKKGVVFLTLLILSIFSMMYSTLSTSLPFRMDSKVAGGYEYTITFSPEILQNEFDSIKTLLEKRMEYYGLYGAQVLADGESIAIISPYEANLTLILMNGELNGIIDQTMTLDGDKGIIKIGTTPHEFYWNEKVLKYENRTYSIEERFDIDGIEFKAINYTNNSITFQSLIFGNSEISNSQKANGYIIYDPDVKLYQYSVPVELSESASKKFADITKGMLSGIQLANSPLPGNLIYYIDDEIFAIQAVPSTDAGKEISSIYINGRSLTMDEAKEKKQILEMAIEGEIKSDANVSDAQLVPWSFSFGVVSFVIGFVFGNIIVFSSKLKTEKSVIKSAKSLIPLSATVLVVLGISSISQFFVSPGWIIDDYSLVGIGLISLTSSYHIISESKNYRKVGYKKKLDTLVKLFYAIGSLLLFTEYIGIGIAVSTSYILYAINRKAYSEM